MRNSEYWAKRAQQRLIQSENSANPAISKIVDLHAQSLRNIQKDIQSIFDNYAKQGVLPVDALQAAIGKDGAVEFKRRLRVVAAKLGLDPNLMYDERYLYRLTRLQALQEQIKLEVMTIAPAEESVSTKLYTKVVTDAYETIQGDLEKQGVTPSFTVLNKEVTKAILGSEWMGGNYSTRIWGNTSRLALELPTIIGGAMESGQSNEKISRILRENFNVSRKNATRLARTETNYFHNQAELQAYVDDGVEEYDWETALEPCETCRAAAAAGPYKVANAVVGTNYPPLHPNDRCTTVIRFAGELGKRVRTNEDRIGRYIQVEENPAKDQWMETMQNQMNPTKAAHDYNADMNLLTQTYKGDELTSKIGELIISIPKDYPLLPALTHVAELYGYKS